MSKYRKFGTIKGDPVKVTWKIEGKWKTAAVFRTSGSLCCRLGTVLNQELLLRWWRLTLKLRNMIMMRSTMKLLESGSMLIKTTVLTFRLLILKILYSRAPKSFLNLNQIKFHKKGQALWIKVLSITKGKSKEKHWGLRRVISIRTFRPRFGMTSWEKITAVDLLKTK